MKLNRSIFLLTCISVAFSCNRQPDESAEHSNRSDHHAQSCELNATIKSKLDSVLSGDQNYSDLRIDSAGAAQCVTGKNITVYFVRVNQMNEGYIQNTGYAAFCLNDSTHQISQSLTLFGAQTIELSDSTWDASVRLMKGPRFSFTDVDQDGSVDFVLKQRVHNGTLYHAVVDRVYAIDPVTMDLQLKFVFEESGYVPLDSSYVTRQPDGKKVNVYLGKKRDERGVLIGNYTIDEDGNPANITATDEELKDLIYTTSPSGKLE